MPDVFEKRLRRAEQLQKEWPFAAEILEFAREVYPSQQFLYHQVDAKTPESFDPSILLSHLPAVLGRIERGVPDSFRGTIDSWRQLDEKGWRAFLIASWEITDKDSVKFAKVLIQPLAAWLARHRFSGGDPPANPPGACPHCEHLPGVSVLREDKAAETVRRSLLCSLCFLEWEFPRVLCPGCQEEKPEKLPRYTAQEIPWMRVEACDSCGKYLKSVDLTLNGDAEPVVDELASTPLDVIAHEHGYVKIAPNLAGI
jgi:formate dehydrogenase maturation protein FdhE